ncbi:MAG: cytochrome d ubiquinol oxidase subunit II [Polyangiales bacterium]
MLAELCAGATLLALIAYGVLGGADFGGGVWDVFARGPRKKEQREAIARAMGPVWEANHVWLIFVIVLLFTVFPRVFYAVSVGLFVPFHLVLVGITLRGAAFAFRSHEAHATHDAGERTAAWGVVFGIASIITPVLLGMCFGAVTTGGLRIDGERVWFESGSTPWLTLFSLCMGCAALSLFAYLAAVFLCLETSGALQEDFRRRALAAGTVVVIGASLTIPLAYFQARHLWIGLISVRAAPVVLAGGVAALTSGWALWRRRYRLSRLATVLQVALLLVGWAAAQYPYIIYPDLSLATAQPDPVTMRFVLWTLPFGAALLGPSLWFLFKVFKGAPPAQRLRRAQAEVPEGDGGEHQQRDDRDQQKG